MLLVQKFGGTSVGSADRIGQAAALVVESAREGHRVVVVTSAMSGVTNRLVSAARRAASGHWSFEERDALWQQHDGVARGLFGDDAGLLSIVRERLAAGLDRVDKL